MASKRIAYFGPAGTFTEEAAILYDKEAQLVPLATIPAVAAAVDTGMADEGIVPIENSLEGSVLDAVDLLIHESSLSIYCELVLPIEQNLLVKSGTQFNEIKIIFSHPQPLAQCRRFIERCFPKADIVSALSTAEAVTQMMASPVPGAAIGARRAAELYGAQILASGIQDRLSNMTRFVVLSKRDHEPTGNDKTSICFSVAEDRAGALYNVLGEFAQRNINLAKIESRPSKESLGKYIFLVDLEGHRLDNVVAEALTAGREKVALFKVFGSYPRYSEAKA